MPTLVTSCLQMWCVRMPREPMPPPVRPPQDQAELFSVVLCCVVNETMMDVYLQFAPAALPGQLLQQARPGALCGSLTAAHGQRVRARVRPRGVGVNSLVEVYPPQALGVSWCGAVAPRP